MCGIAGFWGADAQARVAGMTRMLAHRGPNDEGVWGSRRAPIALGNRRLKILDLTDGGHQPMVSEDGRYALTYNGEIYNYRELKQQLRSCGHQFRTQTDTEVVLAALREWGTDGIGRLEGMFAFALWDEHEGTLLIARDRLGIKPLFYAHHGDQLAFASEISPILASEIVEPALDHESLESFLRLLWIPEPGTLFQGVLKLEPGHYLVWNGARARVVQYWDVPLPEVDTSGLPPRTVQELGAELRPLLEGAVQRQLVADVPVGAFLSGGLDSTTIAAIAAGAKNRSIRSYSIGFRSSDRMEEGAFDDVKYARLAAQALGLDHEEIELSPDVVDLLPKMVRHLEDPVADPAAINAYLICEAARATSTVLLSGSGADELFGGYQKYTATQFGDGYQRIARPIRTWLLEPMAAALPVTLGRVGLRPLRRVKRFLRHAGLAPFERFLGFSSYYDGVDLAELLNRNPALERDPLLGVHALRHAWDRRESNDLVDRMTYVDLKYYLPGLGLAYMDRASMAASVEVRVPLLDDSLVDFVSRLPIGHKAHGWKTKIVLREAVRGLVPEEILSRPKAPFAAPVRSWLRREMAPLIDDYLGVDRISKRGLLNASMVSRLVHEHRGGIEDHSLRLWALLTLEVWCQEFLDSRSQFNSRSESLPAVHTVTVGAST